MPIMDGLEATRRLRETQTDDQMPIIMISASASNTDRQQSFAAGANAFLAKPVDVDALLREVGALLQLTWTYADAKRFAAEEASAGPIVAPPVEELEILHHWAIRGDMREIRNRAAHIANLGESYRPFSQVLRVLAEQMESKRLRDFVEKYLGKASTHLA